MKGGELWVQGARFDPKHPKLEKKTKKEKKWKKEIVLGAGFEPTTL